MAKKPTKSKAETIEGEVFTPCPQCGNPGDCARAAHCVKGFK